MNGRQIPAFGNSMSPDELRDMWRRMDESKREESERRIRAIVVGIVLGFVLLMAGLGWWFWR